MSPQKQYQTMSPTPTDTPPAPQSSALPPSHPFNPDANVSPSHTPSSTQPPIQSHKIKPPRTPLLRLELRDLSTPGAQAFLRLTHASHALTHAVDTVLRLLYTHTPPSSIPGTRSITLVLRELDGVAYTTGLALDDDHKEIHLSTSYIAHVPEARQKEEILGVLVHEMVHCWQHSACGSAPTGLTEGVADWVRLKAGLKPPHWRRHGDCEWDAGYERTAYFLEWLEEEHGQDVVRRINEALRTDKYDAERVWHGCCGKGVQELWKEYKKSLDE